MGRMNSYVDNASSGGITVGVADSGRLKSKAYDNMGRCYEEHPETKARFQDVVIPGYQEVLDSVKRAALDGSAVPVVVLGHSC